MMEDGYTTAHAAKAMVTKHPCDLASHINPYQENTSTDMANVNRLTKTPRTAETQYIIQPNKMKKENGAVNEDRRNTLIFAFMLAPTAERTGEVRLLEWDS
jgi:hypothetical protein